MLSLKSTRFDQQRHRSTTVIDLPAEVLDNVFDHVYANGDCRMDSIIPLSLTCRRFRWSLNHILFRSLTILVGDGQVHSRTYTIFRYMSGRPELLQHVRNINIRTPLPIDPPHDTVMPEFLEAVVVCLPKMVGLRSISTDNIWHASMFILKALRGRTGVRINLRLHTNDQDTFFEDFITTVADFRWHLDLSLWTPDLSKLELEERIRSTAVASHIQSLDCAISQEILHAASNSSTEEEWPDLTELLISNYFHPTEFNTKYLDVTLLNNLRRLRVIDGLKNVLPNIADHLINLQSLGLIELSIGDRNNLSRNSSAHLWDSSQLAHTKLPNLRHLELFHIYRHLTFNQIVTPALKSLKVTMPEDLCRWAGFSFIIPYSEIKWLVGHCPDLERLEIHIGDLENLWNPIAIMGVDVAAEVYSCLEAISRLRKLKRLRLHPRYIRHMENFSHHSCPKQPLSDGQAVRIFHYFKSLGSPLQILSIGATFERLGPFCSMIWTVRDGGCGKTILTIRQARKNYEVEQIWVGERRLTTRNIRDTYQKPSSEDWSDGVFPMPPYH